MGSAFGLIIPIYALFVTQKPTSIHIYLSDESPIKKPVFAN